MANLPEYELYRHSRAKKLKLSVSALGKVKVTAPKYVSKKIINEFVSENADWIQSAIAKQKDYRLNHPNLGFDIPEEINFQSIEMKWHVSQIVSSRNLFTEKNNFLYLYGDTHDVRLNQLRLWLRGKAKAILPDRLNWHASQMGLSYNRVVIKNQKSRWGSCSSIKNINLNQNLLFVDIELVDYLMIHELTHLKYPNHSKKFWDAVSQFDEHYKVHDKLLNAATKAIPLWALPK